MNRLSALQIVALAAISFCSSAQAQASKPETPETKQPTAQASQSTTATPSATATPPAAATLPATATTTDAPAAETVVAPTASAPTTDTSSTNIVTPPNLQGLTPQQVYFKYNDVLRNAKSLEELQFYMAQENKEKMKKAVAAETGPDALKKLEGLLLLVKSMQPVGIKVKKETITGDTATLEMTATDQGAFGSALGKGFEQIGDGLAKAFGAKPSAAPKTLKSTTTGVVTMRKQDGVWKVGEEKWSTHVGDPPKPPTPQQNWAFAAKDQDYPKTPASGKIRGVPFKVEGAELSSNGILTLRQGKDFFADREFKIFLFGNKNPSYENTSYVSPSDMGAHVHVSYKTAGKDLPKTDMYFSKDYGMKLQLGKVQANKTIPGYIVLRMADKEGSCVQGYFYAVQK